MTDLFDVDQIPVVLMNLPTHIRGFCCLGSDYEPCIVLNARLPQEQRVRTYRHEIEHIRKGELYDAGYTEYAET